MLINICVCVCIHMNKTSTSLSLESCARLCQTWIVAFFYWVTNQDFQIYAHQNLFSQIIKLLKNSYMQEETQGGILVAFYSQINLIK